MTSACSSLDADTVIDLLQLSRHPEGGYFREMFRDASTDSTGRSQLTAIYFLLRGGEVSRWHRIDAKEVWHRYGGAPLVLTIVAPDSSAKFCVLVSDLQSGQRLRAIAPAGHWQQACSVGYWTPAGCTVARGFEVRGFELAEDGFLPSR